MVMAGGSGTRLWPVSRKHLPKQLIPFIRDAATGTDRTLLGLAADRLEGLVPGGRTYICTGERYRDAVRTALPSFDDAHILGEPEARDTVNAVGFAAAVFAAGDPDAVFAVLTSDHLISPREVFEDAMRTGFELVERDPSRFVTFSITPTFPATGFGYVELGASIDGFERARSADRFVEKPDLERATEYVNSGRFGWNSGMFVFQARAFMDRLAAYQPANAAGLRRIGEAWQTPDRQRVLDEVYPTLTKISVDYAVMEPASNDPAVSICAVEMPVEWVDVGSWPSYAGTIAADAHGNRVSGNTPAVLVDSRDNAVIDRGRSAHTIAMLGVEGMTVVRTEDATLIMPTGRAQDLKALHAELPDDLK